MLRSDALGARRGGDAAVAKFEIGGCERDVGRLGENYAGRRKGKVVGIKRPQRAGFGGVKEKKYDAEK